VCTVQGKPFYGFKDDESEWAYMTAIDFGSLAATTGNKLRYVLSNGLEHYEVDEDEVEEGFAKKNPDGSVTTTVNVKVSPDGTETTTTEESQEIIEMAQIKAKNIGQTMKILADSATDVQWFGGHHHHTHGSHWNPKVFHPNHHLEGKMWHAHKHHEPGVFHPDHHDHDHEGNDDHFGSPDHHWHPRVFHAHHKHEHSHTHGLRGKSKHSGKGKGGKKSSKGEKGTKDMKGKKNPNLKNNSKKNKKGKKNPNLKNNSKKNKKGKNKSGKGPKKFKNTPKKLIPMMGFDKNGKPKSKPGRPVLIPYKPDSKDGPKRLKGNPKFPFEHPIPYPGFDPKLFPNWP
jgi:hypothetical protein